MANLHLVTGYAGQAHITAEDHGSLNAAIVGGGNYVLNRGNKFAASAITSNQVRVLDGDLLLQGRHVRLAESTYVDLTIDSGAQGMYRNDLIVARYTKNSSTGVEECNLVVIKGTAVASDPADPAYSDGDLLTDHDAQVDFPLYRVSLNGLTVTVEQLFEVITFVTVGADGKIKSAYLPAMNYIPTSQKGAASGVAPLDANEKVPSENLPTIPSLSSSVSSTSTTTAANSYAVKQAYDKGVAGVNAAATAQAKANAAYNLASSAAVATLYSPTISTDATVEELSVIQIGPVVFVTCTYVPGSGYNMIKVSNVPAPGSSCVIAITAYSRNSSDENTTVMVTSVVGGFELIADGRQGSTYYIQFFYVKE